MSLSDTIDIIGLQVLNGAESRHRTWHGALAKIFDIAERTIREVNVEIRAGRLGQRSFLFGRLSGPFTRSVVVDLASLIDVEYPVQLQSPFEDTASVAGAVWSGTDLFAMHRNDGVLKLRFDKGAMDLPMHVHEQSDRYIIVLRGTGAFYYTDQTLAAFTGSDIKSRPVQAGDVLIFTRGLIHTFGAPDDELVLLSYHSPLIPLDDVAQFTLPKVRWTPAIGGGESH